MAPDDIPHDQEGDLLRRCCETMNLDDAKSTDRIMLLLGCDDDPPVFPLILAIQSFVGAALVTA